MAKQVLLDVTCEKRCEKLEAAFQLVWAYSHEISDHVTVIMGSTDLIDEYVGGSVSARKRVDEIARCARRIGMAASKVSSLKEHFVHRE